MSTPFPGDPLAFYGKLIIEGQHAALLSKLPEITEDDKKKPDPLGVVRDDHRLLVNEKVGILGAGIGGLYTALIFDSLDIKYEILEASDSRVGGRLKTHRFKDAGTYDYYEEGAMRFPLPQEGKNGTMKRLANLIDYGPLNEGDKKLKEQLIPFYYTARDPNRPAFYYLNGVHQKVGDKQDPHGFKAEGMGVTAAYIKAGAGSIHADAIDPFVRILTDDLKNNTKDGWAVMTENDIYSVRGYLASKYLPSGSLGLPPKHLSNDTINWISLLQGGGGGFDRALTEAVFSEFSFHGVDVEWKCFKGGSETLSEIINNYLKSKEESFVKFKKRVTAISKISTILDIPASYWGKRIPADAKRDPNKPGEKIVVDGDIEDDRKTVLYPSIAVTVAGEKDPRHYDHVISTLPLTVLRTIDLHDAELKVMQKNALRALDYGVSIKIAVRFKSNWWYTKLGIFGGQSFTDLPIGTIVYPSYGTDDDPSKVLIASYTRTTDAARLGALAVEEGWETLKELVLRNLAKAHYGVNGNKEITYEFLVEDLAEGENFHVKDWNADKYTMGAFAYFSPGEFQNLYASLNFPAADGCLHFAGEALSTRHGWVVGALDSAWRAVFEYLGVTGQDEKLKKFKKLWDVNNEWTTPSAIGGAHSLLYEHIALLPKFELGHND